MDRYSQRSIRGVSKFGAQLVTCSAKVVEVLPGAQRRGRARGQGGVHFLLVLLGSF